MGRLLPQPAPVEICCEEADAAFKIAFSRFNPRTSADSFDVVPDWGTLSILPCRNHFGRVSDAPLPSNSAAFAIAAQSET